MSVKWNIIVPVKQPADLKGVAPGKLPDNLLKPVKGGGKLHWRAADAWDAMVEAAKADGIELKPVSSGDTYRTFESQLTVFRQRYQKEPIEGAQTRTFEGVKWYKKDPKLASLAAPGTSQHNSGLAVDVHTAAEPKRLNWLIDNVRKFGFSWEVVPEEPWHLRYTEGDNPPAAVVEYVAKRGGQPAPQTAPQPAAQPATQQPAKITSDDDGPKVDPASLPHLTKDYKGPAVKRLQRRLAKHGIDCLQDGDFGPKTQNAVREFQKKAGLPVTGDVDTATWTSLLA
jgi:murein L,D-transpeptidase YcbB/YkuD